MTTGTLRAATSASLALLLVVCGAGPVSTGQTPDRPLVTPAQYERWFDELSNWGRWGPDDEMGALNLITPARRRAAADLVTEGFTVSLASIATTERTIDNPCPVEWSMVRASPGGASDTINYACIHGPGTTHIDGFAHRFFDGRMWNGYPIDEFVTMEHGATKNAILTMRHGVVTRGVLYDIPRLKGVPLPRARGTDRGRRPRSVGGAGGRQGRARRRVPAPLGTLGASGRDRSIRHRAPRRPASTTA